MLPGEFAVGGGEERDVAGSYLWAMMWKEMVDCVKLEVMGSGAGFFVTLDPLSCKECCLWE